MGRESDSVGGFLTAGSVSALFCWAGEFLLPEQGIVIALYPGVVLGVALYILGSLTGRVAPAKKLVSLSWLVIFTVAGWRLAVDVGYDLGGHWPFTVAGLFGGLLVAPGLLLSWRTDSNPFIFCAIATAAGGIGGWIFRYIDRALGSDSHNLWVILLFLEWQVVLMLGIFLALKVARKQLNPGDAGE